jgi:hypothetical protein
MDIDELTLGQLKQIAAIANVGLLQPSKRLPMPVGTKVFVRTVTHIFTGLVVETSEEEVAIEDACWVADTGRYADTLKKGEFGSSGELEPYPSGRVVLNRGAFIDWCVWEHALPRSQK